MSLKFMSGLGYASIAEHDEADGDDLTTQFSPYVDATITSLVSGSQGTKNYWHNTGSGIESLALKAFTAMTTFVIGFRVYRNGNAGNDSRCVTFLNGGTVAGSFGCLADGRLAYSEDQRMYDPYILAAAERPLPMKGWNYVELKVVLHATTGSVEIKLNGQTVASETGIDTIGAESQITQCIFNWNGTYSDAVANEWWVTDIYLDDSTLRGPMDIWYQPCDTSGSAANFTPSAGNNEDNVDELGNDGDTTYNASTATSTLDQLAHSDSLDDDPIALQPLVIARYVPTGSANIKVGVLSGTTHDQASAEGITDGYRGYLGKIYETDPDTASAWTASGADAAETTYEHAA